MNRFASITAELKAADLWGFPVSITYRNGQREKRWLVEWKPYQDRPPTAEEIDDWCWRFPDADAGIPTGPAMGIVIIDADDLNAIRYLWKRGMPRTWATGTNRGSHYYFRWPAGVDVRTSASEIAPHIDVRGRGGTAIWYPWLPPQREGERGYSPKERRLADMPDWLLAEFKQQAETKRPVAPCAPAQPFIGTVTPWADAVWKGELERLEAACNGTRNNTANRVGFVLGRLCGAGQLSEPEVTQSILVIAAKWEDESFATSKNTVAHAIEEGKLQPRDRPVGPKI